MGECLTNFESSPFKKNLPDVQFFESYVPKSPRDDTPLEAKIGSESRKPLFEAKYEPCRRTLPGVGSEDVSVFARHLKTPPFPVGFFVANGATSRARTCDLDLRRVAL